MKHSKFKKLIAKVLVIAMLLTVISSLPYMIATGQAEDNLEAVGSETQPSETPPTDETPTEPPAPEEDQSTPPQGETAPGVPPQTEVPQTGTEQDTPSQGETPQGEVPSSEQSPEQDSPTDNNPPNDQGSAPDFPEKPPEIPSFETNSGAHSVIGAFSELLSPVSPMLSNITASSATEPWNLREFVTGVEISDADGNLLGSSNPPLIGNNYKIEITFAENPSTGLQLSYDGSPATDSANTVAGLNGSVLVYQMPDSLVMQNAIPQTPIRFPGTNAIIGWYTISATNATGVPGPLLHVWFANVNSDGDPTPDGSNFIDYYSNVELVLDVTAQFTAGSGGNLDFGGGEIVEVPPPIPSTGSLTINKTSSYRPDATGSGIGSEGAIYYMVSITALGQDISNIVFTDAITVNGSNIANPAGPDNAISQPLFEVQRNNSLPPESIVPTVTWNDTPTVSFTATFTGLILEPGEFITARFHIDIEKLIENNSGIASSLWNYNFTVNNRATANGNVNIMPVPPVSDNVDDQVGKSFEIHKSGSEANVGGQRGILWSIVVGGEKSPNLVNGRLFDMLGDGLVLPPNAQINIRFFNDLTASPTFDGTAATLNPTSSFVRAPDTPPTPPVTAPVGWDFALTVPGTYGPVYKIEISYFARFANQTLPPSPETFTNEVEFFEPDGDGVGGGGSDITINQGLATLNKTSGGLCGHPALGAERPGTIPLGPNNERYWIDYHVEVIVPGGLHLMPLYLYDTLGRNPGGSGVPNVPMPIPGGPAMVSAATYPAGGTPVNALIHTDFVPYYTNAWRMFFGFTGNTISATQSSHWPFEEQVKLTLNYRIWIPDAQIDEVKANPSAYFQNTIYLMNQSGSGTPQIGNPEMRVAADTTNDYWPLFKKGTPSADAAWIFNYTATINGAYSDTPFFRPSDNPAPVFSDVFDSRLKYVAGSFYMVNTQTNRYYAFPGGSDVTLGTNSFTANLNQLREFSGSRPDGGWTGTGSAPPSDWLNVRHKFEIRYQLEMVDPSLLGPGIPSVDMTNTATISRAVGACTFDNDYSVTYDEHRLSKSMVNTPDGSGLVRFEIIVNPDGSIDFGAGAGSPPTQGPDEIFAVDVLQNLNLYMDSVRFFTRAQGADGTWVGGFTVEMPKGFNNRQLWSVNSGSPDNIDAANTVFFVIPNRQPVKIVYDALVTLPPGASGTISNTLNLMGESDGLSDTTWEVGDAGAGAVASRQVVRVFKRDTVGNNIKNATFDLYATNINMSGPAGGLPPVSLPALNQNVRFGRLLSDVLTNDDGIAVFDHELLITRPAQFLFVLHERIPPDGFETLTQDGYTFFTIDPTITQAQINSAAAAIGISPDRIAQIPDFITIINEPIGPPNSLRVIKKFQDAFGNPIPEDLLKQYLQDFELTVTDQLAVEHVYSLEDLLNPDGVIIEDIAIGRFHFRENHFANIPDYIFSHSSPELPFHRMVFPNPAGPVTIMITNVYTKIPPPINIPRIDPLDPIPWRPLPAPITPHTPVPTPPTEPPPYPPQNPSPTPEPNPRVPQTGDNSSIIWYAILLCPGGALVATPAVISLRKKYSKKGK